MKILFIAFHWQRNSEDVKYYMWWHNSWVEIWVVGSWVGSASADVRTLGSKVRKMALAFRQQGHLYTFIIISIRLQYVLRSVLIPNANGEWFMCHSSEMQEHFCLWFNFFRDDACCANTRRWINVYSNGGFVSMCISIIHTFYERKHAINNIIIIFWILWKKKKKRENKIKWINNPKWTRFKAVALCELTQMAVGRCVANERVPFGCRWFFSLLFFSPSCVSHHNSVVPTLHAGIYIFVNKLFRYFVVFFGRCVWIKTLF